MGGNIIWTTILMFLSLWGAVYLETGMQQYFLTEMLLIGLLVLVGVLAVMLLAQHKRDGWKVTALFFGAALVNMLLVYSLVRGGVGIVVVGIINLMGLVLSVGKLHEDDVPQSVPIELPDEEVIEAEAIPDIENLQAYSSNPEFYAALSLRKPAKKAKKKAAPKKKKARKKKK